MRKRRNKPWSSEEARKFLEFTKTHDRALYAAYTLILVLGLRRGEVLGLTWADIELDEAELIVGRQLQRVSRQLLHRDTKTPGSDAALPLPSICMTALRLRKTSQQDARKLAGAGWQKSELVFTTATCAQPGPAAWPAWRARVLPARR